MLCILYFVFCILYFLYRIWIFAFFYFVNEHNSGLTSSYYSILVVRAGISILTAISGQKSDEEDFDDDDDDHHYFDDYADDIIIK